MKITHYHIRWHDVIRIIFPLFLMTGITMFHCQGLQAQDKAAVQADAAYQAGRFRQALSLLEDAPEEPETFRIRAFIYIATGDFTEARQAVYQLIELRPNYYTREDDPVLFQQMVADAKAGLTGDRISSVSKTPEKLSEAPATVMVIKAEDIRNRGYIDLEAFFSDLPGFDVSRTFGATYSNIYQRGYRSNNTDRTLFLLDGIEENDFWGSFPYWARQYPTTNVDRVEIIYGPASTMYGANAFLGVVNVITKDPFEGLTDENPVAFTTEAGTGSYNTRFAEAGLALKKKSVFLSATSRVYFSDEHDLSAYEEYDFEPEGLENSDNLYRDALGNDATDEQIMMARNLDNSFLIDSTGENKFDYNNTLQHLYANVKLKSGDFLTGFQTWKSWHGSLNYATDLSRAPVDKGNNVNAWQPEQSVFYVNYEKAINDNLSLSNVAQFRTTKINDESSIVFLRNYSNGGLKLDDLIAFESLSKLEEPLSDSLLKVANSHQPHWDVVFFNQKSKQFRNEVRLNYAPINNLSIVGGVEVKSSLIQGDYNRNDTVTLDISIKQQRNRSNQSDEINYFSQRNLGTYFQGTYAYGGLFRLTLGGRLDYVEVRDAKAYDAVFNPRIALVVTPFKKEELVFKGIYATAFQEASIRDRYSTAGRRIINTGLKTELVQNFELGINYKKNDFQVDAAAYHAFYSNVISEETLPNGDVQNQNKGQLYVLGMQSSLSYRFRFHKNVLCRLYANYNYTLPQEDTVKFEEESHPLRFKKKFFKFSNDYDDDEKVLRVGDISTHRLNLGVNVLFHQKINLNLRMNFFDERPVGSNTTVEQNTKGTFEPVWLLNGAIAYRNLIPGLDAQLVVNNLTNAAYQDPGIRRADGITRAFRTPQKRINGLIKFTYTLPKGK